MYETHVPKNFRAEAVMTATYLINRVPSSVTNEKPPIEVLTGEKPFDFHLRVFGCQSFLHV